jgi:cytochrome c-type biogenesis protein CcmF
VIIEIGHFALILAFAVACVQSGSVVWAAVTRDEAASSLASSAAKAQFVLVAMAFAALIWAYVTSDFSVLNVATNSHTAKPLVYKISGVWGNHEGSMLLWVFMLSAFGGAVAWFGNNLPLRMKSNVLAVQGLISIAFLAFVSLTSNPFLRLDPAPMEGKGLNPILQDPGLAIHPPLLYAGYVGLSISYSFAIAALIEGRAGTAWARWVRPWTLAAWMFLTLGIVTGSWWAYYELGWGGWWYWDPVENASFVPWLAATALLHSAIVTEKREALKGWTVFLAIFAFTLSLIGTFIVRSGVLTSVHAFAVDPARGAFVLAIIFVLGFGALLFFAIRAPFFEKGGLFSSLSRETSLLLNNIILLVASLVVLFGTLYPLFVDALFGEKLSVGAPFFNIVFGWLMVPLVILLPFGPLLAWKRGDLKTAARWLIPSAILAVLAGGSVYFFTNGGQWRPALGICLAVWVIAGMLTDVVFRSRIFGTSTPEALRRLVNLPRSYYGAWLAHIGLGLMMVGIVASITWRQEHAAKLKVHETVVFAGYGLTFEKAGNLTGPNYLEAAATFTLRRMPASDSGDGNQPKVIPALTSPGTPLAEMVSSKRRFVAPSNMTTETAIYRDWTGDYYVALSEIGKGGQSATVRVYFNPLVRLIWYGGLLMAIAGLLSLTDRRLRIGAPVRKRQRETATEAANAANIAEQTT